MIMLLSSADRSALQHHRHFREIIVSHRGRRVRYRIRARGHRIHLALIEARLRQHPEWVLDPTDSPHLPQALCTVHEEPDDVERHDVEQVDTVQAVH